MRHILTTIILFIAICHLTAQYDLEVDNDAKIKGELFVEELKIGNSDSDFNTVLGWNSGNDFMTGVNNTFLGIATGYNLTTGNFNVFLGQGTGFKNTEGNGNTFIGLNAGMSNTTGDRHVFIGERAGFNHSSNSIENLFIGGYSAYSHQSGDKNTFIGARTGYDNLSGSGNIFIGWHAGKKELNSNKLYIENSDSNSPLIYGDFDTDVIQINGSFHVKEFVNLQPRSAPPSTPLREPSITTAMTTR